MVQVQELCATSYFREPLLSKLWIIKILYRFKKWMHYWNESYVLLAILEPFKHAQSDSFQAYRKWSLAIKMEMKMTMGFRSSSKPQWQCNLTALWAFQWFERK